MANTRSKNRDLVRPQSPARKPSKISPSRTPAPVVLAAPQKPTPRAADVSEGSSFFSFVARVVAWYTLYTVLFRCPDLPTPDSPGICHPANTIKAALRPHVQPYYDSYVSPYVHQYSPYVHQINKDYVVPTYNTLYASYVHFGEPYVAKGTELAAAEYDRLLKPHVAIARGKAEDIYSVYVSPHAEKASHVWVNDVKPTVDAAEVKAEVFYKDTVLPNYKKVHPYIAKAYEHAKYLVLVVIAPVVKEGGEKAVGWGIGMWSEVVRPQVGRIGERLGGSNGNGVPASAVSSSLFSSLSTAQTSKVGASDASISSMISAAAASKASDTGAHKESAKPTREEAKEMIKNDLFLWSSKFSASSVKTLADLKSTIDEISDKAYSKKVKDVGNEILSLQKLVDNGFITLKAEIQSLTRDLTPESTPEEKEAARESLIAATRRLGTEIRDKTQQIRKEAELYLAKVYDDVSEAADQHLEVLDGINEMGMQELGMKWAWMDYVSYKDWAKYHDLKKEMKESRTAIIRSAEANDKLQEITHWVENEWEGKATDIAKHAAEELKRIKKIGKRKFELADASEDFSDSIIPVVVQKAGQQVLGGAEKFKVAVAEKEKKIINGVEKLKIDIAGVKEHSIKQKIINGAKEFKVSIPGEKEDSIKEKIIEAADDVRSKVDEAIYGTPTPVTESIASAAESVISQVSEKIYGTEPNAVEKAATAISSVVSSASSAVSSATERIKINVPGGVEAGFVAAADSILFDDDDSVVDNVKSRYAEASMAVSQAINEALYRTEPSVHESLMSKASELSESAVSVASSILYGTPTPVTEALASIATDKYSAAVAAASRVLYGTPTPTHELLLQQLKDVYAQATAAAQDAYSASNFGATKVEKPVSESIISAASEKYASALSVADVAYASILSAGSDARRGYDATVADAQRVLNEAASAASIKIYGTPQPASESIMSVAREKYYSASQEAQKNYDSWYTVASEQIYGTPGPFYATILSSASAAASAVSQQVEDTASVIAEKADDAASAVSTAILGAPAPTGVSASAASIVSEAEASVSDVQDLAALRYDQLQALVSELVHGKEPTFSESVMLRFSEALYGTPTPVLSQASSLAASATSAAAEAAASLHPAIEQLVTDAVRRVKTAVSIDEIERTGREAVESLSAAVGGLYGGTREEEKSYKDQVLLYATGRINRAVANAQKSYRKVKDEL